MTDDWWPDLLKHIPLEDHWAEPLVTVAEDHSFTEGNIGERLSRTALVSPADLERLQGRLRSLNHQVETSGPRPMMRPGQPYRPTFSIDAFLGEKQLNFEPLVLSWTTNNQTALVLDPGFAMTYGLMPRSLADGSIHWDDPSAPEFDVAVITPPSIYDAGERTIGSVRVSRDHLQDYLTLRDRVLVQVYYEKRYGKADPVLEAKLNGEGHLDFDFDDRLISIIDGGPENFTAQVWGARILAMPKDLPITSDTLDTQGLVWPGLDQSVTTQSARHLPFRHDLAYVRDAVLSAYEGRPLFDIHPGSGAVSHGSQWSVSYIRRIGRDLLQLELRKLYEGAPPRVIRHWHGFAITPPPVDKLAAMRQQPNVATRSRAIVDALLTLGEQMQMLADRLGIDELQVEDFIGMERAQLPRNGWWKVQNVEPITRYFPLDLPQPAFLQRCLQLNNVAVEALGKKPHRRLLTAMGAQKDAESFAALKLLDRLLGLTMISRDNGLPLVDAKAHIVGEFQSKHYVAPQPITRLFALNDLRQEAGHPKDGTAIPSALKRFGSDPGSTASGWGSALDAIYDGVAAELRSATAIFDDAFKH